MTEQWVPEAIAQQEEYLKRRTSCGGLFYTAHSFRPHGKPSATASWSACVACGVTETDDDYQRKIGA